MFKKTLTLTALSFSLAFTGCDGEKKAAEAKALAEKQAAEAKAAAEKAAADAKAAAEKAAAEAAAKAKEAVAAPKAELAKKLDEGVAEMDGKIAELKKKAEKLSKKLKPRADEAIGAYETAKAAVVSLKEQIEGIADDASLADVTTKVTAAIDGAKKALADAEAAVAAKK